MGKSSYDRYTWCRATQLSLCVRLVPDLLPPLDLKKEIIRLLEEDNPGLLLDEAQDEADRILYRKDLYEQAKYNLFKIN